MSLTLQLFSHQFHAMGSPCCLQFYCISEAVFNNVAEKIVHEVARLECKYSRYLADSLVSKINTNAGLRPTVIDNETQALCQYAATAYHLSDGLFDVTSGTLRKIWDVKSQRKPDTSLIPSLLPLVNWSMVAIEGNELWLPKRGMEIDFGGIVKEYAADSAKSIACQHNIQHGIVDLGGDIAVIGTHPNNSPWHIGISKPTESNCAIASLPATSGAVASSGDYERFILLNNVKYSHIVNPKTGWPVNGFAGVSVWAPQCVVAGTIATIAMLKEEQAGLDWLRESGLPFVAVNHEMECFIK